MNACSIMQVPFLEITDGIVSARRRGSSLISQVHLGAVSEGGSTLAGSGWEGVNDLSSSGYVEGYILVDLGNRLALEN